MSHSSMLASEGEQSDSRILIEACLARVREEAGLDTDPADPPLDVLVGLGENPSPRRVLVGSTARQLPRAPEIEQDSVRPEAVRRAKLERPLTRRLRWPVLLCGFIGGIFGGAALMTSPVGRRPAVRHAVTQVQSELVAAYSLVATTTSRLVKP